MDNETYSSKEHGQCPLNYFSHPSKTFLGCVLELLGKTVHHSASQLSSEANADDHDVLANAAGV